FPLMGLALYEKPNLVPRLPQPSRMDFRLEWKPNLTFEEYCQNVAGIRRLIAQGDIYQLNYTWRLLTQGDFDSWQFFLAFAQEAPYAVYAVWDDWVICSASPELFFRLNGSHIETRPMKGTAPRGRWPEEDAEISKRLAFSEKDRAENVMIVDMVRNDVGRIAETGSVKVASLFEIEKYPTVWQMTSTVCAKVNTSISGILQALFPAASITGTPKCRSMQRIADLETTPRRIYTGSVGYILPKRRAQFNVAIRTVLYNRREQTAEYGVGGGIVWDSYPKKEHQECLVKAAVLYRRPISFDLFETLLWRPNDGYILFDYHLERLQRSADYFDYRYDLQKIRRQLYEQSRRLQREPHKVRLFLSACGNIRIDSEPLPPDWMKFGPLIPAKEPIDSSNVFLFHKTTFRKVYEAAQSAAPKGYEILLYNESEEVTETTTANVAFEIEGVLYTPPIKCGLLAGTFRRFLLERGLVVEKIISLQDLANVQSVYLFNSIRGLQKVKLACQGVN
ncbi:MAG: aminodeoxychorismate synthase component I, partial [candidate division KSB1 bacterium]|nr:aminodeoxychorismate synthase component I [candidate division KSB1 bacterium]